MFDCPRSNSCHPTPTVQPLPEASPVDSVGTRIPRLSWLHELACLGRTHLFFRRNCPAIHLLIHHQWPDPQLDDRTQQLGWISFYLRPFFVVCTSVDSHCAQNRFFLPRSFGKDLFDSNFTGKNPLCSSERQRRQSPNEGHIWRNNVGKKSRRSNH